MSLKRQLEDVMPVGSFVTRSTLKEFWIRCGRHRYPFHKKQEGVVKISIIIAVTSLAMDRVPISVKSVQDPVLLLVVVVVVLNRVMPGAVQLLGRLR